MVELPIALGDAQEIIGTRRTYVVKGDFTQRKIDRGRDTRFERVPPAYQGFLIYVDSDENQVLAGRDNLAIAIEDIPDSMDPRNVAKSIIDTGRGEYPRLLNEMPHIGPLASRLGVHHLTQLEPHEPYSGDGPLAGKIGKGIGWSLSGNGVTGRAVIQFEEPGQATEEAISTALQEELPVTNTWTQLSRNRQGRVAIVDGKVSYDTLLRTTK